MMPQYPISVFFQVNENRGIDLGRGDAKYLHHSLLGKTGLQLNLNKGHETFREKVRSWGGKGGGQWAGPKFKMDIFSVF